MEDNYLLFEVKHHKESFFKTFYVGILCKQINDFCQTWIPLNIIFNIWQDVKGEPHFFSRSVCQKTN